MPDTEPDNDLTELAKVAYDAYGETTGHKNYQGLPMPEWDDLGDAIQGAWIAAAQAVQDDLIAGATD